MEAKHTDDIDDDELFETLENDDFALASLREQRMEQLKREYVLIHFEITKYFRYKHH